MTRDLRQAPGQLVQDTSSCERGHVSLLGPHLTAENHVDLLRAAAHKPKREVECMVAALRPQPDVAASVRKLPARKPGEQGTVNAPIHSTSKGNPLTQCTKTTAAPAQTAVVRPLAPERYKVQFTASRETYDKLRRVQDLLRHQVPSGDVGTIVNKALSLLLADILKKKLAATECPRAASGTATRSRHIPASVKREVWRRDGGQCAFIGSEGRCGERAFLEFHHVEPYAAGGESLAGNLELRCRAHNAYEAELFFADRQPMLLREAPAFWAR